MRPSTASATVYDYQVRLKVPLDQIERFAPGTRDRVLARHVTTPTAFEAYNPNYVGGDIATGATDAWQMVARPRLAADPYATGIPGVYLCSAATPPGAGVHGMCGHLAARRALRHLQTGGPTGRRVEPQQQAAAVEGAGRPADPGPGRPRRTSRAR